MMKLLLLLLAAALLLKTAVGSTKPGWLQRATALKTNTTTTNTTRWTRWRPRRNKKQQGDDSPPLPDQVEPPQNKGGFASFFFPSKNVTDSNTPEEQDKNKAPANKPKENNVKPEAADDVMPEEQKQANVVKQGRNSAEEKGSVTGKDGSEPSSEAPSKEKKGLRALLQFQRKSKEAPKIEPSSEKQAPKEEVGKVGAEKSNEAQPPVTTAPPATNQTATPGAPQQKQPQGVIVTSTPTGFRVYPSRPEGMILPAQQYNRPIMTPSQQNSMVIIEVLSSIAGTAMRLWFLTWLTRRMASQEESIQKSQHFVWERLNDKYDRDAAALKNVLTQPPAGVSLRDWKRKHVRKIQGTRPDRKRHLADMFTRTVVVVELSTDGGGVSTSSSDGSIGMQHMASMITFLIQQQRNHAFGTRKETGEPMELEIVFLVNSPGGSVASYGLAAAQMRRLADEEHISTTVCVDKFAASGGYMIASQADRIVAAPFATVGSIGVVMEGFNFHELAKKYGVQPLVLKAGDQKNPLSNWGPVQKQDLELEQQRLVKVHEAFRDLVVQGRPALADNLKAVTDGSVYLGLEAKELAMVDDVMTSDDYILARVEAGDRVVRLHRSHQIRFSRQIRLSPLDILPHLRTWIVARLGGSSSSNEDLMARLVKAGTWVGFAHHLIRQYGPK